MNDVPTVILAGGKGTRSDLLTRNPSQPAVVLGGSFRIVDFVLSNFTNSGPREIPVVMQ